MMVDNFIHGSSKHLDISTQLGVHFGESCKVIAHAVFLLNVLMLNMYNGIVLYLDG